MPAAAEPPPERLPEFPVSFAAPDLGPWRTGNCGVRGFTTRSAAVPGPHVMLTALIHGNEIAGAVALARLLAGGLAPLRGRLTAGFVNLAAFDRFDPADPTASRFVDEDMNRVWEQDVLEGGRRSCELARAREIRPLVESADVLLDLHSMLWPSDPLILCGPTTRGRALAERIGTPSLIVADHGHAGGRRLIDYARFVAPDGGATACLVEAGQHWERRTIDTTLAAIAGLLRARGMTEHHPALPPPRPAARPRLAEVTRAVTAESSEFAFVRPFRGGEVVKARDTLIARDGAAEILTPHDDCLLVMPSLRPSRGHTAIRLARFLAGAEPEDQKSRSA